MDQWWPSPISEIRPRQSPHLPLSLSRFRRSLTRHSSSSVISWANRSDLTREYFMKTHSQNIFCRQMLLFSSVLAPCPCRLVAGPNDGSLHLNIVTTGTRGRASGSQKTAKINIYTPDNICHLFHSEAKRGFENQWTKQNLNDSINLRRY